MQAIKEYLLKTEWLPEMMGFDGCFFIQIIRFSGYGKIQKEKRKEKARADWEYNQ